MLITKIFKFMNLTTLKNTVSRATGGKHKNKQIKKKNTQILVYLVNILFAVVLYRTLRTYFSIIFYLFRKTAKRNKSNSIATLSYTIINH